MAAYTEEDVQAKLYNLEEEERLIMQELIKIDEADHVARVSATKKSIANPRAAINSLIAECEKEVRNAKGYIKSNGPPLQIARCKPQAPNGHSSAAAPKHATFLSRPKDTGVDFTIPVTLPDYLTIIKSPIFLNDIRDKCKAGKYSSSEDYLEDMRLLARNTAMFNKGEDLAWVVQHARLLLEAAEDAVAARRDDFYAAETALRAADAAAAAAVAAAASAQPSKRKRSTSETNGASSAVPATIATPSALAAGTRIAVLWPEDQIWYLARVLRKTSTHRVEVEYEDDQSTQIIDLRVDKWRHAEPPVSAHAASGGTISRVARTTKPEPAVANKRQKTSGGSPTSVGPAVGPGVSVDILQGSTSPLDIEALSKLLSSSLDEFRALILQEVNARFDRIEQALLRSDAMRRVLLTVDELRESMEDSSNVLAQAVGALEERMSAITERMEICTRDENSLKAASSKHEAAPPPDADCMKDLGREQENAGPNTSIEGKDDTSLKLAPAAITDLQSGEKTVAEDETNGIVDVCSHHQPHVVSADEGEAPENIAGEHTKPSPFKLPPTLHTELPCGLYTPAFAQTETLLSPWNRAEPVSYQPTTYQNLCQHQRPIESSTMGIILL